MTIAGIDEAGRGALAGPVVAGAVIIDQALLENSVHAEQIKAIKDSKIMTDAQRRLSYEWITRHCEWATGIIFAQEIDLIGIKSATEKAMNEAVEKLLQRHPKEIDKLKVDGRDHFQFPIFSEDIVGGDGKVLEISAASIVAKVLRDDLMIDLDHKYPQFGFAHNKGYGAAEHMELIKQGQYCLEHRQTYDPLKTFLHQGRFAF